jgi:exonuclease SbcC
MRIKHLRINGFRGFACECQFDLSSDATVIVGANGLGKTSLFDAILWGLSGSLPRVGNDNRIVSLYSENGQARVNIILSDDFGNEVDLTRSTDGETQTVVLRSGQSEYKGSSATSRLFEKLWPEALTAKAPSEAFASAICRSVYLQQDRLREFVESNDEQERFNVFCELVGTGRLTELQASLESESKSWTTASNKLSKEVLQSSQRLEELNQQLENSRRVAATTPNDLGMTWELWWQTRLPGEDPLTSIPSPLSVESSSIISERLRKLQALREAARRSKSRYEESLSLLRQRPVTLTVDISPIVASEVQITDELAKLRRLIDEAKREAAKTREAQVLAKELHDQNVALAKLALGLLSEDCPVCLQKYDIEATRKRLESLLSQADIDQVESSSVMVSNLVTKESELNTKLVEIQTTLRNAKEQNQIVELWKQEVIRKLADSQLVFSSSSEEELLQRIESETSNEVLLTKHIQEGESLSLGLARTTASARIKALEEEVEKSRLESAEYERRTKIRDKVSQALKQMIEELRDANSRVAIERLKEVEPFVQRIYSRIDPHPSFRVVSFATTLARGKGRLNAKLQDRFSEVSSDSPSAVLSSSQLNALAVSIFLGFNLVIPKLPIQSALLDDPLQSLDDINLLGVIDLLRRVKDQRQLLVSTHDSRFGRLLARKLRPTASKSSTSLIEFFDWTRNGPVFTQTSIEADTAAFKLVLAS